MTRLRILATVVVVAACGDASDSNAPVDASGAATVRVSTVGVDLLERYMISVDSGAPRPIGINDSVVFAGLRAGGHSIALTETGADCTAAIAAQSVSVAPNATTSTSFDVTCWGRGMGSTELAFTRHGDIYRAKLNGTGLIPLTSDHMSREASWSPDGRRIAFSSQRGGTTSLGYGDIYIMDADGSNVVRRTTNSTNGTPVWSPDGRTIAFTSWTEAGAEVYTVSATEDGRNPTRLTAGCYPDWSHDGHNIAFSGQHCDDLIFDDVYVMDADGSNLRRLTNVGVDRVFYSSPRWSPDDRRIAVAGCRTGCTIGVMNADGSGYTGVATGWGPRWSPSGRIIAFAADTRGLLGFSTDGGYTGAIASGGYDPTWKP